MLNIEIKRKRLHLTGNIIDIDSTNLIGFKPSPCQQKATMNLDIDGLDSILNQMKTTATEEVKEWYRINYRKRKQAFWVQQDQYGVQEVQDEVQDKRLKSYQLQAVKFFLETKACIIGYDMGLGKTFLAITCIKAIKAKKTLIVCPAYLKYSWEDEFKKWSNLKYTIVDGTPTQRDLQFQEFQKWDRQVLIINYEQIRIKVKKNGKIQETNVHKYIQDTKFDLVIWDEAHRLKNRESQISYGAMSLKTDNKLMLTGTPVTKNPGEVYSLLRILDRQRFTSYWTFVDFFCHVSINQFRGYEIGYLKKPKLYQHLMKQYMIRKLKEDVAQELPDKIFIEIPTYMYPEQKQYYDKALNEFIKPDENIIESDVERFIRLCQIAQNPCILGGQDISVSRDTTIDLIQDIDEQRIIVACTYIGMSVSTSESLNKCFKNRNIYLINSKIRNRHEIIEKFKKDRTGVLVTTIKCLSEGANLDCCDIMIFMDIEWNCGINKQFENRIHRMTSTRKKMYYFIIVKDSVLEYKHQKINMEKEMVKSSLGDSEQKIIKNIMEDFRKDKINEL